MPYTRRDFLKNGAFFISMGVTAPAFLTRTAEILEAAVGPAGTSSRRIVIIVQLSGGNDGLNTVVPFADPLYLSNRPTLGLPTTDVIPLNDSLGLHGAQISTQTGEAARPALQSLKDRYDLGQVAIIQNVGYPNPNRSHFRSMDIWHSGVPERIEGSGWLGRYLDACCNGVGGQAAQTEVDAWSIGSTLPLALWTSHVLVPTINSVNTFSFQTDGEYPSDRLNKLDAFKQIYADQASPRAYDDFIRKVGRDAVSTSETLQTLAKSYTTKATFPSSTFAQGLKTISQLIAADFGTRIYYISTSGFDTHAAQQPAHGRLLRIVSDGIDAFLKDMDDRGRLDDVVMLCFSEFGRRVKENGSKGTDHGTAAPMFAIGKPVKGGIYGENPDLKTLSQGDLLFKIDFRAVYSTILANWFGGNASQVLGGSYTPVPYLP